MIVMITMSMVVFVIILDDFADCDFGEGQLSKLNIAESPFTQGCVVGALQIMMTMGNIMTSTGMTIQNYLQ